MFIRDHLLNKPTTTAQRIASRIATTIDSQFENTVGNPFTQILLSQKLKSNDNLIIHYKHEARLTSYKTDIHQLWNHTFTETPVINTKLTVGNRNSCNTSKILIRRRPHNKYMTNTTNQQYQN
jgi:hypothetical protein